MALITASKRLWVRSCIGACALGLEFFEAFVAPADRVRYHGWARNALLQPGEELFFQAVLAHRRPVVADAPVAVARAAIFHVSPPAIAAHDHEARSTVATSDEAAEKILPAALGSRVPPELLCPKPLAYLPNAVLHGTPECIVNNAPRGDLIVITGIVTLFSRTRGAISHPPISAPPRCRFARISPVITRTSLIDTRRESKPMQRRI
jgi:hypothetical protein